jgi:hypothetical protein
VNTFFSGISELNAMANRIYTDPTQPGHFAVEQEGLPPVSIRYNESTHSLRFQSADEQRVFFLEQDLLSDTRIHLYSEYGLSSGSCHLHDQVAQSGTVRCEGQKLHFRRDGSELEVQLEGRQPEHYAWSVAERPSPEAVAGVMMLLCRRLRMADKTTA